MHCEPVSPPNHLPASSDPDRPVYKVIFWRRGRLEGYPPDQWPWEAEEWAVYDADGVHEVLAWTAHEAAEDQTYTIHVATIPEQGRNPDLLWLDGVDPTIPT
jgi:hypothetical protein